MANSSGFSAVNGNLSLAIRALGAATVSAIFLSNPTLAIMTARQFTKPDEILGIGDPDTSTVLSGAELPDTRIKEIEECNQFSPQIFSYLQMDQQVMPYRGNNPQIATCTGTPAVTSSWTYTIVNGVITAVTVPNNATAQGTGYAGVPPTLVLVDTLWGWGAEFQAVVTTGGITTVKVICGGQGYNTNPTMLVHSDKTAGEKYSRPVFKWCEYKGVAKISNRDVRTQRELARADKGYFDERMETLMQDAMRDVTTGQANLIGGHQWTGQPNSDDDDIWTQPYGFLATVDDGSNYAMYAGVDRTLTANYFWRSPVDAVQHDFGIDDLVDDAEIGKGISSKGGSIDLFLVGTKLFQKYKRQVVATNQEVNLGPDLKMVGQFGFKAKVLKYGDTYIVLDRRCPAGTALGLSLKSWVIAFRKGAKFTPSGPFDQTVIDGGYDGSIIRVNTQWMPMCWAPSLNVKYTNLI